MSVTGHGAKTGHVRHPDDWYATPAWATRAIMRALRVPQTFCDPDTMIDPCCGDGAILDVAAEMWPGARRMGVEIDRDRAAIAEGRGHVGPKHAVVCGDALGPLPWGSFFNIVITNPPYALAMEFVERSLREVAEGGLVVMLLRIAWLASQKRAPFLRANTPSIYVLPKRPSFTGKGTDSADYAWFVWGQKSPRVHILEVT